MSITVAIFDEQGVSSLTRWGYFMAACMQRDLIVLCVEEGKTRSRRERPSDEDSGHLLGGLVQEELKNAPAVPVTGVGDDAPDGPTSIRIVEITDPDPSGQVLETLKEYKTELLIVRKHRSSRTEEEASIKARKLFESAPCATLLLRSGDADPLNCKRILVPVAGGPHAVAALGFARDIAVAVDGELVPFYVVSGFGEDARAVGMRMLEEVMTKAGVESGPNVKPEVWLSDQAFFAIGEKAVENFDLVIMGASNIGSLRKLLFGTIPNRLLSGDDATAIGVIRHAKPIIERVRRRLGRWLDLVIPQLEREDRVALFHNLQTRSVWNFDFMALIALSTSIAALGLIQDSTAVVIGAMLVAPLMTPMLGAGLALVQGNLPLMRKAMQSIVLGYVMALATGMVIALIRFPGVLTNELAARGGHSSLDFAVALLSGMAAAYCIARPGLSAALAGVAIAAALVPPIATTGISLVMGQLANAQGSALLFGTNLVAIILGASVTFYAAGIRGNPELAHSARWVHRTLVGLLIAAAVLFVPIGSWVVSSMSGTSRPNRVETLRALDAVRDGLGKVLGGDVAELQIPGRATPPEIYVELHATSAPSNEQIEQALALLQATLDSPVKMRLKTELFVIRESEADRFFEAGEP